MVSSRFGDELGNYREILQKNMIALRKAKGWSQERGAQEIGTTQPTLNSWEKGKIVPNVENLEKIATAYGVLLPELFKTGEAPKPRVDLPDTIREAIEGGNAKLLKEITQKLGPVISALQAQGAEEVVVREVPKDKLQVFFNRLLREPGFSAEFYKLVDGGADYKALRKAFLKELQEQEKGSKK